MSITQIGTTTTHFSASAPTTLTKSYNQVSGTNTIIVVGCTSDSRTHDTVTFNGIGLTKLADNVNSTYRASLWYLVNPTVTTANVVLTMSGGANCSMIITSWENVNQSTPFSNFSETGGSSTLKITCFSDTDELVIDCMIHENESIDPISSQTEIADVICTGQFRSASSYAAGANPSVLMSYGGYSSGLWSGVAGSLKPTSSPPPTQVNYYKVEQLVEQSTSSTTFVDIPGTTLTFTPSLTSEIWMVFASGAISSSATQEQTFEMNLMINGVEHDLWSHQNSTATAPVGAGFLVFDRITGTTSEQTVKLQFKALSGTCYADDIRVIAAKVPDGADFQYYESNSIVTSLGSNLNVGQLQFTPPSQGNYFIICSIKHREHPSGSTSQAWFESVDAPSPLHPNAPTGTYHSNAREPWNPTTYIWRDNLTPYIQTINIRFTSSGGGSQNSEHRYRKIMVFREDAWDEAYYNLAASETSTTGTSFVQKNSVTTTTPSSNGDYLSIQTMRIGGTNSSSGRKSGEIRIGGSTKVKTNHIINRDNSSSQGYHHTVGLCDTQNTASAVTYENGFSSPNAITVNCAESAIVVLRYPSENSQTHQMII